MRKESVSITDGESIIEKKELAMKNFLSYVKSTKSYLLDNYEDFNYNEKLREASTKFYNFLDGNLFDAELRTYSFHGIDLKKYNIDVVTHIMVGLPNETKRDLANTVNFLNKHNIKGLKIHSCYVVKNTILANMYENGKYTPVTLDYYLNSVAYILTHVNPNIIIHRVSGDAPNNLLLAPNWNLHKKWIINGLDKLLKSENLYQGMYYKN